MSWLRRSLACITLVLGSCFALRAPAADGPPAPGAAAVLPATGELPPGVRRALTIELRRGLAARGYSLVIQERVREVAAKMAGERLPGALDLSRAGEILGADLVIAPRVEREPGPGVNHALTGIGVRSGGGFLGPSRVPLPTAGGPLSREDLARSAEQLLLALLSVQNGTAAPAGATGPALPEGEAAKQPADIERHDQEEWYDADHDGFFGDLSFLLSWCTGDLLCATTGTGYGGRLRLGWRIASYVAVSATAVFAGHSLPTTTDLEELARTERMLLWYGFHGGVRLHPVNRSWFDPFAGFDLGWTRLYYTEKVEADAADCSMSYMGVDLCEYTSVRNSLRMDGFTVTPQLGVNFFVTRNVALGIVAEFLVPFWSEACNEVTRSSFGESAQKDSSCVDVEDADGDFLTLENGTLDDEDELPWHFDLELHLSFSF
ncbi:MAG TPA: hypothetical protein VM285_16210 [Polyangia bacterium]|nr:hypothetical protein [Polyangia bacterium]